MFNPKRFLIATVFGVIFGFICYGFTLSEGPQPWFFALSTIISRTLIGFTIGISILRMPWWLHGIVIGALFSIPMGLGGFYVPGKEMFIFTGSVVMGIIYGFLIELFTSVIFKAKIATA